MVRDAEAEAALTSAYEHGARGEEKAAIPAYQRALALGLPPEERCRALLGLGSALVTVGRHEEAVQVLRAAIGEFPQPAALRAFLGVALHANGDGRQAMVVLLDLVLRYVPIGEQAHALGEHRELLMREPLPDDGWPALAASLTRKEFVHAFSFPFLLEISGRMRAAIGVQTADEETQVGRRVKIVDDADRPPASSSDDPFVLPLRKVATAVPSALTVGRGNANDVILPDPFVSKVHAFLRMTDSRWEMSDAGSRNGAWIGGHRLDPKGAPSPVRSGDVLTFGRVVFFFLDAAGLWDRMRNPGHAGAAVNRPDQRS
jgi:FHA domain/Tetratrico peptide repeat